MGLVEAQAREDVAYALEIALEAGTLAPGTAGFKRRQAEIVADVLTRATAWSPSTPSGWSAGATTTAARRARRSSTAWPTRSRGRPSPRTCRRRWWSRAGCSTAAVDGIALTQTGRAQSRAGPRGGRAAPGLVGHGAVRPAEPGGRDRAARPAPRAAARPAAAAPLGTPHRRHDPRPHAPRGPGGVARRCARPRCSPETRSTPRSASWRPRSCSPASGSSTDRSSAPIHPAILEQGWHSAGVPLSIHAVGGRSDTSSPASRRSTSSPARAGADSSSRRPGSTRCTSVCAPARSDPGPGSEPGVRFASMEASSFPPGPSRANARSASSSNAATDAWWRSKSSSAPFPTTRTSRISGGCASKSETIRSTPLSSQQDARPTDGPTTESPSCRPRSCVPTCSTAVAVPERRGHVRRLCSPAAFARSHRRCGHWRRARERLFDPQSGSHPKVRHDHRGRVDSGAPQVRRRTRPCAGAAGPARASALRVSSGWPGGLRSLIRRRPRAW